MIYQPSENGIEQRVRNWIYTFSGDAEVRMKQNGLVYLVCDGYFGQEQYVAELGVVDNPEKIVSVIRNMIDRDPRTAVKPRAIVMNAIAELAAHS